MSLAGLRAQDITESSLRGLINAQAPEGKTIDYKSELPGNRDSDKKDFLADLCSFANASGGHLVFGVKETGGNPVGLAGLSGDIDQAILRLESIARDGIRPSIPGLEFVRVSLENGNAALIVVVPKSWNPPHQVIFQKDFRFYTRGSAGKQHFDVEELRRIILTSQELGERTRQFRAARIAAIMAGESTIELVPGARQVLHFVPLAAFGTGVTFDLARLASDPGLMVNTMKRGGSVRYNVDGLVAFSPSDDERADAYSQLYRNGVLESVGHLAQWTSRKGNLVLPSSDFEEDIFRQTKSALAALQRLGVTSPIAIMLSFIGIKGWEMGVRDDWGIRRVKGGFDRDPLLIPEVLIEPSGDQNLHLLLKPMLDVTWNAAGFAQSDYYDSEGNWKRPR